MVETELSTEAQEALTTARLGGLKKKLNADSWSDHMEDLLKAWGEKAAGLRFMHNNAAGSWKALGNKLTMWGIGVTTIVSTVSLTTTSVEDDYTKNVIMYAVGGVGVFATLIQSAKKFYNSEEKAANHSASAKQFGSFYRYMTLQMGMAREDRVPADELSAWSLKEFERLQQDAPPLGGGPIAAFKKNFKLSDQAVPDVCEDEFIIRIYGRDDYSVPGTPTIVSTNKRFGVDLESSAVENLAINVQVDK
jgi:hypothetical protein